MTLVTEMTRPMIDLAESKNEMLDCTLSELRGTRRLEEVASSIQRFMLGQFTRLEEAISECEKAAQYDQVVQRMLAEFDQKKSDWEQQREEEAERLRLAYEKLMDGWKQLEEERRRLIEERESLSGRSRQ